MIGVMAAAVLSIVSTGVIYNVVMAQQEDGPVAPYVPEFGDEDIVAMVGGIAITRGEIKSAADYRVAAHDAVSREHAIDQLIVVRVDTAIQYAEALRLGYESSDAETLAFVEPIRAACNGSQGEECRRTIERQGLTAEEYWRSALPGYKQDLSIMKLWDAHLKSRFPGGATLEQQWAERDAWAASLRESAAIEWRDEELRQAYDNALRTWTPV